MSTADVPRNTGMLTLAGMALAFAGTAQAASAWQLESLFDFYESWVELWVYTQGTLGVGALLTGFSFTRATGWTLVAAPLLAWGSALLGGAWIVFAMLHGLFTLVSVFAVALCLAAGALVTASHREARRLHAFRVALGGE